MTAPASGTFGERAEALLARPEVRRNLAAAMDRSAVLRARAFEGVDLAALRAAGEAIRAHTVARLDRYLARWAERAEARGTRVSFAADAAEAVAYVREVAARRGARLAVKGKSMVSEEVGLNRALEEAGVEVLETDLGEYIQQLAGEPPAHITVPAVHRSRAEVRELFARAHGADLPDDDPARLTRFAREVLRERFLSADLGITGVNFAVAETGSIVIVTNEGNGRMCSSLPPVHVALMGMERVVPSFRELAVLLPLLTGSATGQRVTSYVNVVSGPRGPGEPDGPEELHVVVVDNGRSRILGTRYRSILHCIRCGACLNVCPVFRQVGGLAYGSAYGGPLGAVLAPLLEGFDRAGDLPWASSLCGACTEVCPVGIPLHEHLAALRADVAGERAGALERGAFRWWARAWSRPVLYSFLSRLARWGQRPFLRAGRIRRAPFPLARWTRGRDLAPVAGRTFRERWRASRGRAGTGP
ncbi:MAG TPA: LutB/LldF family L-lactate oxidation iron-sulfur protein, partial [Actinomycetota bacterium]|nr:LutB/LldF family L-lactate oxidation iron-sulfur protein [Actinomycetota bacterium]